VARDQAPDVLALHDSPTSSMALPRPLAPRSRS
jgi:hypothetical protein